MLLKVAWNHTQFIWWEIFTKQWVFHIIIWHHIWQQGLNAFSKLMCFFYLNPLQIFSTMSLNQIKCPEPPNLLNDHNHMGMTQLFYRLWDQITCFLLRCILLLTLLFVAHIGQNWQKLLKTNPNFYIQMFIGETFTVSIQYLEVPLPISNVKTKTKLSSSVLLLTQ